MQSLEKEIQSRFIELFQLEPLLVRSPGRINLIGEHTDYNDGFVMPAAIDKAIIFAIAPSTTGTSTAYSYSYNETFQFDLTNPQPVVQPGWANFLSGVIRQLVDRGLPVQPFNVVFGGDVPLGAGLSSSAAVECGFAFALNELFQLGLPKIDLIKIGQWAEHNFVGVMCGIMDQFASVMGKEDHVIVLDCRSLSYSYSPINLSEHTIILCDTKVKHSLVDSEYNKRRKECETGVQILRSHYPQVSSLRDVSFEMLAKHQDEFPDKVYDRCFYIVGEIDRVPKASDDLKQGDLVSFGKKMYDTHEGLSKFYQVSCEELDFLVREAKKFPEVLGSRMMGGGFGGCTINIVKDTFADSFISHVTEAYRKAYRIELASYKVKIKDGTSILNKSAFAV